MPPMEACGGKPQMRTKGEEIQGLNGKTMRSQFGWSLRNSAGGKKKKKGKLKIQHDQIEVYITLGLITIVTE